MATYNEQLQTIWHKYEDAHAQVPATARDAVAWGIGQGLIAAPKVDPLSKLAEDMAKALRDEMRVDKHGRRYRVNHALRITKAGVQYTFWHDLDRAPRAYMEKSFAQRRNQIVGDCLHLKTDVDVYNDAHRDQGPIQMVLDFTADVEEKLLIEEEVA